MEKVDGYKINVLMAEKVLGWETDKESGRWITPHGLYGKHYWNPYYNFSDAFVVFQKFDAGKIESAYGREYTVSAVVDGVEYTAENLYLSKAICDVALKAYNLS